MGKESTVEVAGPDSVTELASHVRRILHLPEGQMRGEDEWAATAVFVERVPWQLMSDHRYQVTMYTGDLAESQGRQVFDGLAASTDWALRLLDDEFVLVRERPAVKAS